MGRGKYLSADDEEEEEGRTELDIKQKATNNLI